MDSSSFTGTNNPEKENYRIQSMRCNKNYIEKTGRTVKQSAKTLSITSYIT